MVYAYLRVSTKEQNLARQIDELKKSGTNEIEIVGGKCEL